MFNFPHIIHLKHWTENQKYEKKNRIENRPYHQKLKNLKETKMNKHSGYPKLYTDNCDWVGGQSNDRVHGLCLFGCACDGCLVVGAGGRPPEDEGGGSSEDRDSEESSSGIYVTPLQSPADSASSTPDQTPHDMFLPLIGPGQWPDQAWCTRASHARAAGSWAQISGGQEDFTTWIQHFNIIKLLWKIVC